MTVLRVFRWAPGEGARWQEYRVATGPETTVLDALVTVQREQDPTLAFRWACRVGMCGSCAMVVNGRERWACRTRLAGLGAGPVTVRPLYHFPLLRDLVVDMAPFVERMRRVDAVFRPRADAGATRGPGAVAPHAVPRAEAAARREIDAAIECIGCGMCLSACTIVGANPRFPGPAALNRVFTLALDPRDGGTEGRWLALLDDDALPRCHGQGTCTEVCPMGLEPTRSIVRLRQLATRRLLRLGAPARALVAALLAALATPVAAPAQTARPHVILAPAPDGAAPWSLATEDRRATVVAGLPEPRRYRVCNDSTATVTVVLDTAVQGLELPGRACVDVSARTITLSQRAPGIPAHGTYLKLD